MRSSPDPVAMRSAPEVPTNRCASMRESTEPSANSNRSMCSPPSATSSPPDSPSFVHSTISVCSSVHITAPSSVKAGRRHVSMTKETSASDKSVNTTRSAVPVSAPSAHDTNTTSPSPLPTR